MDSSEDIRFDSWTLRRQPRELYKDDTRVRLQDQPLRVLEELLTHAGEVVTREQLISRLWPKRVVDFDTALNAAVRRLRGALGDDAGTPRYIETIPRHGYRFIGTVDRTVPLVSAAASDGAPPSAESHRGRRPWHFTATLIVALGVAGAMFWYLRDEPVAPSEAVNQPSAQAEGKSIAVLPFEDLSPEQDQ